MGKRGPKPKSYEIKQQKGDTHLAKSIKPDFPDRKMPPKPKWLKGAALAFWNEYAPRLHQKGLLVGNYRHSFAILVCDAYGDYIEATADYNEAKQQLAKEKIEKKGTALTVKTKNNYVMENPLLSIKKKAWEQKIRAREKFYQGCSAFGLTPSDIGSVRAVEKPTQNKDSGKFFED